MIKTVGDLRKALERVPDDIPFRIKPQEERPNLYVPLVIGKKEEKIFSVSVHEVEKQQ